MILQALESKLVLLKSIHGQLLLINFISVGTWYFRTFSGYLSLVIFIGSIALGRPPSKPKTQVPRTENGEINTAWTYTRSSWATDSTLPTFDLNYGIGSCAQLKYEIAGLERRAAGEKIQRAISDSIAGIKWRVRDQENFPISVFPQIQFQTFGSKAQKKALSEFGITTSFHGKPAGVIAGLD